MNIKLTPAQLSTLLKKAFQRRRLLLSEPNAYRLINSEADQLAHVTIDFFSGVFVLRTFDQTADALIPPLAKILAAEFDAKAVLLKNHNETRRKKKLALADKILTGGLEQNRLSFDEGGRRYDFDTRDEEGFQLEDRPMRAFLRSLDITTSACLAVTPRAEGLLPCDHQMPVWQHIPCVGLDFSALTAKLRKASPHAEIFDAGVLDLSPCKISPEHRKATFHLLHGFLKRIRTDGRVHIKTRDWQEVNKVLAMIATKGRRPIKLVTIENSGADFAVPAGEAFSVYATWSV